MRTLAIESATTTCSVALFDDTRCIANAYTESGRGVAERLLPMIATLPDGGRADQIRVDCGPGSFTGIRVGIAAARALALGWNIPVYGYSSLALIAATWFARNQSPAITVVIEGGHGEVFTQNWFADPFMAAGDFSSVPIPQFAAGPYPLIGNAAHRFGGIADIQPEARHLIMLPVPQLDVHPLYGRGADAKPMA